MCVFEQCFGLFCFVHDFPMMMLPVFIRSSTRFPPPFLSVFFAVTKQYVCFNIHYIWTWVAFSLLHKEKLVDSSRIKKIGVFFWRSQVSHRERWVIDRIIPWNNNKELVSRLFFLHVYIFFCINFSLHEKPASEKNFCVTKIINSTPKMPFFSLTPLSNEYGANKLRGE